MVFLKLSLSVHPPLSLYSLIFNHKKKKRLTIYLCSTLSAEKCAFSIFRMIATKLFKGMWVNNSSQPQVRLHLRFKHWSLSFWYQRYVEIFIYIYLKRYTVMHVQFVFRCTSATSGNQNVVVAQKKSEKSPHHSYYIWSKCHYENFINM